jgi:hypothetical protein
MESEGGEIKSSKSFIKHVFNFEDEGKAEFLNVIQYALLAIIPIIILNKTMQKFVPEADEQKGSFEILAEVFAQIIVLFVGLIFINRIITYVPTYSGIKYPEHNVIFIVTATLMIILSLQTKLGDKVTILVDRITELWEGKSTDDKKKNKGKQVNGTIKVSQPISQNPNQMTGQMIMREAYTDGTSISNLPTSSPINEQQPNFNKMYAEPKNPLVDASNPITESYGQMGSGIMAANEALGGSFSGSSW